MKKEDLERLTNKELDNLLNSTNWCDKDLLEEHDERIADGRIKLGDPIQSEELEEYFNKRRESRMKRAS